jgi:hypothetical protein
VRAAAQFATDEVRVVANVQRALVVKRRQVVVGHGCVVLRLAPGWDTVAALEKEIIRMRMRIRMSVRMSR